MVEQNIAILGGKGMLGSDLAELACNRQFSTSVLDLPEFDITDHSQLETAIAASDVIINCAAYTNVDGAESEYEQAYAVNAEAVGNLGKIANQTGKYVIHLSTDFIFDGTLDRPYVETDIPNPINAYGKSKLVGEQLLQQSGCDHCIIRIQWTYGLHGNNFVAKLLSKARPGQTLKVVDDQVGCPTATTEVARIICSLPARRPKGIFHFASAEYASRFDMAKFILEKKQIPAELIPCKTSDFPSPAKRPLNSRFNCGKIQPLLDEPIKPWQQPLEQFLKKLPS